MNSNWSEAKIEKATNKAYKEALSKGVPSGEYTYTTKIYGEKITVNFNNGVFSFAWGSYKLKLSDFGY